MIQRGSGLTTRQMIDSPIGSIYVIPGSNSRNYMKQLVEFLGRTDLDLVPPGQIRNKILGSKRSLIVDHAVWDMPMTNHDRYDLEDSLQIITWQPTS